MTRDPMDRLRDADPLRDLDVPGPGSPDARELREALVAGGRPVTSLARARRRRLVAGTAAAVAAVGAAAAVGVTTLRTTDPTSIGCFVEATTTADTTVLASSDLTPVAQCRELWEAGLLEADDVDGIPDLVACALEAGVVGVFPAASCDVVEMPVEATTTPSADPTTSPSTTSTTPPGDLTTDEGDPTGLPLPDAGANDEDVRAALEQIRMDMLDRCLTLDAAIDLARGVLDERGIEGWEVGPIFDGHDETTCAGFFPAPDEQAVWFTPEPPAPGQTPSEG